MKDPSVCLLIVDGQNDFCEGGRLPIEGGSNDMKKIAAFIDQVGDNLKQIIVTMDHHPFKHVGNANVWSYKHTKKSLSPGDEIDPVRALNGHVTFFHAGKEVTCSLPHSNEGDWQPPPDAIGNPTFTERHTLWPAHCMVGSKGHALHPEISRAIAVSGKPVCFITKGDNPDIEEYSAVTWRNIVKRKSKSGETLYNIYPNMVDMEVVKKNVVVLRSPLLDKLFQLALGFDQDDPDLNRNYNPKMDVLYVAGLASNICVCRSFDDIMRSNVFSNINKMRPHSSPLRAFIVDDLTSEYVPENVHREPLQLVSPRIGDFRISAVEALDFASDHSEDVEMSKKNANEYKKMMGLVEELFTNGFENSRVPKRDIDNHIHLTANGERRINGSEEITVEGYYRAVSNYPCYHGNVGWGPVDPLDREFYNKYLITKRKSYMVRHFLLGNGPSVPPMTDMFTPEYGQTPGKGHFDFFGPNHLMVIVTQEESHPVFLLPLRHGKTDFRFICSSDPEMSVPSKWLKNPASPLPNLERLGTWYLPIPFPCKHAWCEVTFFTASDVGGLMDPPVLNNWEFNVLDAVFTKFVNEE